MELKYKGYTIKIEQDDDPFSPRDNDNIGTMVCFHSRYDLGDKGHGYTPETLMEKVKDPDTVALPLFLLDHSGLWISTGRYAEDPQGWDTSAVGYIIASKEKAAKEGIEVERLPEFLEGEVKEYNDYLTGNVHGFVVVDKDGDEVESCWGFIGDPEESGVISEAKGVVDCELGVIGEQTELFPDLVAG